MGYRLTKIYTRTGDDGTTALSDGSRVEKDTFVIEAIGAVDELNSAIGIVVAHDIPEDMRFLLSEIQHDLFEMGGQLSSPEYSGLNEARITAIEKQLDDLNDHLPHLREFILPAGNLAVASCHLARSICRRAERRLVTLTFEEPETDPLLQKYLNRLSDFLFVTCRILALRADVPEVYWRSSRLRYQS
ncbi:MAG: cob(I)yrinic acid a,c-diamide adenosyltransferase [Gammaproteobacteria bacterium]|nr:cob(I)yrinic acid a,c-diamide adenosyltransferase [Gammaproteobacteria bacterium]